MKKISPIEFNEFAHKINNTLNSVTLHAELGKMLIDDSSSVEEIRNVFTVILQQCKVCEEEFAEMRDKLE